MSSILYFFNKPIFSALIARFNAVCPPIVGKIASGFSFFITSSSTTSDIGSIYVLSATPGSVIIVAGFELINMTLYPSSFRALQACVPE